ncbi:MAG: hypothetical protein ABF741_01700 [Liquorilactobacillus ghanensis]|uniref:hypothetical protein n=1 Tax=Liquorilactobacillus ghanensis TaxID=399370 RepID=UPI0039EA008F
MKVIFVMFLKFHGPLFTKILSVMYRFRENVVKVSEKFIGNLMHELGLHSIIRENILGIQSNKKLKNKEILLTVIFQQSRLIKSGQRT